MRKQLIADLRSFAANLTDPNHAAICAVMREAADELETSNAPNVPSPAATPAGFLLDDDGVPAIGRACLTCGD
jgi:hypothetical protein